MLLAALGIRTVELSPTETWATAGSRGFKPANVSPTLTAVDTCVPILLHSDMQRIFLFVFDHFSRVTTSTSHDNANYLRMPQVRHHSEIRENELLWSRRFLVWKVQNCSEPKFRSHVARGYSGLPITAVRGDGGPTALLPTKKQRLFRRYRYRYEIQSSHGGCPFDGIDNVNTNSSRNAGYCAHKRIHHHDSVCF